MQAISPVFNTLLEALLKKIASIYCFGSLAEWNIREMEFYIHKTLVSRNLVSVQPPLLS